MLTFAALQFFGFFGTFGSFSFFSSFNPSGFFSSFGVFADLAPLETQLSSIISNITGLLTGLGVTIAVLGIAVGGIMRATAFGNERKVAISNQAITCAVIGLVIVLLSQVIGTGIQSLVG